MLIESTSQGQSSTFVSNKVEHSNNIFAWSCRRTSLSCCACVTLFSIDAHRYSPGLGGVTLLGGMGCVPSCDSGSSNCSLLSDVGVLCKIAAEELPF